MDLADTKRYREDPRHRIIIGVDLGKRRDFTALTISEVMPERRKDTREGHFDVMMVHVRDIQRLPLGTDYQAISRHVHRVFWDKRLLLIDQKHKGPVLPTLLVDAGGVGEAVCDTLAKNMGLRHIRYRLVRGTAQTKRKSKRDYTVPRTVMFQQLYAAFTTHRIKVDPRLKLAKGLIAELKGLQVERNEETGYERVTHREGEHDDMAICIASTNWWANLRKPQPARMISDEGLAAKLMGIQPEFIASHEASEAKKQPKPPSSDLYRTFRQKKARWR